MKRGWPVRLVCAIGLSWLASVLPVSAQRPLLWQRRANTFRIEIGKRPMEIELVTASLVRVSRGVLSSSRRPYTDEPVEAHATGLPGGLQIDTQELRLQVSNTDGLVRVSLLGGLTLLVETAAQLLDGAARLEFEIQPSEKLYGFGPRPHWELDARGLLLKSATPSYISSRGYSVWFPGSPLFEFDVGSSRKDRLSIRGQQIGNLEYFLAFGPSVKEIWEQRMKVQGSMQQTVAAADVEFLRGAWLPRGATPLPMTGQVCEDARALVHAALSGVFLPAFDLAKYQQAEEATFQRAVSLGLLAPVLFDSSPQTWPPSRQTMLDQVAKRRKQLNHYLLVYADEVRARGYPVIHPLLMQFPRDPLAARRADLFMVGDEMLVAPFCDGQPRTFYLPMGQWTDWNTERIYPGKREVELEAPGDGVILLIKNGSIVPVAGVESGDPTQLHYFPKNGGEFFIYEPEASDYTQIHASPAAEVYRLEIESKVSRLYEWVLHHMDKPAAVEQVSGPIYRQAPAPGPLTPGSWRYDERMRRLHIGVDAAAHSDVIVNVRF
ncbi:MAG: hypothetical protein NZV14_14020 [Bryobacteraceae bacterium]|nr:hypothetical protein [Bryobacteraceae bacterium]MDW8379277.1 glycoside hydrolase family 31 protein [Bryobacterales bacterium]